jgi:catechol 2,3-dioxygenase-like lactoylglutathione lyase family enzyme
MFLKHVAIVCSSEKKSDKFYEYLLGLKKQDPKILPGALSRQIFNRVSEYKIINYTGNDTHFEIFIDDQLDPGSNDGKIEHICIEVEGLEGFLAKCRALDVKILRIPKGDRLLTFIRDFDGNLFEITSKH